MTSSLSTQQPPESHFYRQELLRSLEENRDLVRSYTAFDPQDAVADIILLEGNTIRVRGMNDGFVNEATGDKFDTLDSLLLNVSPAYMSGFNDRLTRKLESLANAVSE